MSKYSISKKLVGPFEEALGKTRDALERDGFGVVTEINMTETIEESLHKDMRGYRILSACDPALAHKAITVETEAGLLLPCHVIVYENDEGGSTVAAIDPVIAMSMIENPALAIVARELREKLDRIISGIN